MPLSSLAREALLVAVYNSAIALFLTAVTQHYFTVNLIYSHAIGFSIYAFVRSSGVLRGKTKPDWLDGATGIPFGLALGFVLGTWGNGLALSQVLTAYPDSVLVSAATALVFGAIATWMFRSQARIQEAEAAATRAELASLQAQIEPHFLFNTLSNVVGLIDTDPAAARTMLLDLTTLLRTSLTRTRLREVTLAEELDLLRAYLGIMAVRMGSRLAWRIDADDGVLGARLPPLLVQPLVENAIRHGLEPKPAGGSLTVRCRRDGNHVEIAVEDSGVGIDAANGGGVGLANVRERLRACYGAAASLALETNAAGGVAARLRLPLELPCVS